MSVFRGSAKRAREKFAADESERYSHDRPIKVLTAAVRSIRPARHMGLFRIYMASIGCSDRLGGVDHEAKSGGMDRPRGCDTLRLAETSLFASWREHSPAQWDREGRQWRLGRQGFAHVAGDQHEPHLHRRFE